MVAHPDAGGRKEHALTVIELSDRRPPVEYTVRIRHHWDGHLEVLVDDLADDERSLASVGHALRRAASLFPEAEEGKL
jgi:hypothetical protein